MLQQRPIGIKIPMLLCRKIPWDLQAEREFSKLEEGEYGRTIILPTEKGGPGDDSCDFISAVMKLIVKRCRKANT